MSLTSELLPEPETPVTQTNAPSGISTSMFFRLLCVAPTIRSRLLADAAGVCAGISICCLPERYWPVRLRGSAAIVSSGAGGDDLAAAHAGAGAEIDDVVGRPHRVFVVLDDDDRVAQVAQLRERVEQPVVVARVQADRRLVENVEHADQAAADLAGQADALRSRRRRASARCGRASGSRARRCSGNPAGREFP